MGVVNIDPTFEIRERRHLKLLVRLTQLYT